VRRRARLGRASGPPGDSGGPAHRVEVRVCPPRPGFHHPVDPADVARALALFGPPASYGLRRIELRQSPPDRRSGLLVAGLAAPGTVVLFEQPRSPWTAAGRLTVEAAQRLWRAGARIEVTAGTTRIDWPGRTLRDFVLFDGLMHEIGHHMIQQRSGKPAARVRRTADHERCADAFAVACRLAWTTRVAGR
jgi:hypothetical protein